jgi:hypothetical protein
MFTNQNHRCAITNPNSKNCPIESRSNDVTGFSVVVSNASHPLRFHTVDLVELSPRKIYQHSSTLVKRGYVNDIAIEISIGTL